MSLFASFFNDNKASAQGIKTEMWSKTEIPLSSVACVMDVWAQTSAFGNAVWYNHILMMQMSEAELMRHQQWMNWR